KNNDGVEVLEVGIRGGNASINEDGPANHQDYESDEEGQEFAQTGHVQTRGSVSGSLRALRIGRPLQSALSSRFFRLACARHGWSRGRAGEARPSLSTPVCRLRSLRSWLEWADRLPCAC